MATLVVEAFLSASVQTLLDRIASNEFRDFFKNNNLKVSLLNKLKIQLMALSAVLNDAEEKQITNPAVKEWLDELKDAVLDAEDLLDEINTDSLRCKVEAEPQNVANQVWNFLSSPFNQLYREINSKMEGMCQRLDDFANQKDILGLQSATGRISHRTPTTSLVNESVMVGRKDDEEKLIKMLLSDDTENGEKIGVVAIFGMGGVGKTALAQLVYNNKQVQEHFHLKAWACVSEDYDVFMVTKTLLEKITSRDYNSSNLDLLRVELKQHLMDKKYLFVLDDLWNDKYNDWHDLIIPFSSGKRGSKIIVTTRQQRVAEVTRTFPIFKCDPLSKGDCWCLLAKHAFGNEDFSKYPLLEAIGRRIAKKCGGLPLAAKTVGGVLRSKLDPNDWNNILKNNIWDVPNDDVLPALRLSYLYLPAHLKRCFAYCSIFPKDYLLDKKQLVLLWMAEGLVPQSKSDQKTMEKIGEGYFDELLSRSLIQQSKNADERKFVMHDLVNDLASIVSGKSCSRLGVDEIPNTLRHLSYQREWYDPSKKFELLYRLKCLRSFLPLGSACYNLTQKVSHELLPLQKYLRVLTLSQYYNFTELPDSIGNLVHLRYLNLDGTGIKRLPNTTCKLYNLQTLILSSSSLTELPAQIGQLVNLRHLNFRGTELNEIPTGIKALTNIQTLTSFVVGQQPDGLRVRELRNFPHLQGQFQLRELQNVINVRDASDADLKNRQGIEELELQWDSNTQDSRIEKDVLEQLQPSTNLSQLTIRCYGGTSFPSWLGHSSFSNTTSLSIIDCNYCLFLPPLGQLPSLKRLVIEGMKMVKSVGAEFYGSDGCSFQPFPSLEELTFYCMSEWEEWLMFDSKEIEFPFPCVRQLSLVDCPKLRGYLPHRLPSSLIHVRIANCDQLEASAVCWMTGLEHLAISKGRSRLLPILDVEDESQCSLQSVDLREWESLQSLPKLVLASNCLQRLGLFNISSLTNFPTEGLLTLRELDIQGCPNLELPPYETWRNCASLENFYILNSCHSMTSIPLDCFPSLKNLRILRCPNLKSLSISKEASPQSLPCLESLNLGNCPSLESFPKGGLSTPNLTQLRIYHCEKLGSLSISAAGFQHLTSLSSLTVGGDNLVEVLLKEPLLPTSLVSLIIQDLAYLKFLQAYGLRHLSSLKVLRVKNSERLESLPQHGLPSSLEELGIYICPMLRCLPEDGLPSSLSFLKIDKSPQLDARYQSQREKYWHKIAHIPVIVINDEVLT